MGRLIGAHAALTRELSARLVEQHGLTLSEFEVLLLLAREPDRKLRRTDLAQEVRLSPSGVTRMLDRLEASGLVEKGSCATDARVTYAVLTDAGQSKLEECSPDHFAAVERLLGARFDEEELVSLAELLGRVTSAEDDEACEDAAGPGVSDRREPARAE
jgi:MarR family 2-MHQ and catechol resistance regulon transcriptional repressor